MAGRQPSAVVLREPKPAPTAPCVLNPFDPPPIFASCLERLQGVDVAEGALRDMLVITPEVLALGGGEVVSGSIAQ